MYDTEEQAKKDWQSISPEYRTKERLDEMMMQVRQTATTIECTVCGNTDPAKFSVITGGGGLTLDGARCLLCAGRNSATR